MSRLPRFILSLIFLSLLSLHTQAAATLSDAEKSFAEIKVYSADGKPWRDAQEDWDGAKKRIATDDHWKRWLEHEQAAVDKWMSKQSDRVSWVCGWAHDFISPKDGAYLTWTSEIPEEDVSFFHSPSDPHVEITPKLMAAWVYDFRYTHAQMMYRSARLYKLTGNKRYAEWSAAQLDFYSKHYYEWQTHKKESGARLYWQTLDEATSGFQYINTVRLIEETVDPARKQYWWDHFFKPEADLLNSEFLKIHNIANWHRCCVAAFALVYHDDNLWHKAIDGQFGLREQIAKGITDDYLWYEQSFHYNEYVVEALRNLFEIAGLYHRTDDIALEIAKGENLMLSPIYLRFPNNTVPNPADGTGVETAPHRSFLASTYRVFPTTLGLDTAKEEYNWNTLIDPPQESSKPNIIPAVTSRNMAASNMAMIRKGPWQIFLHYGQLTQSHSQAEALNYSVFYGNDDITHDPGTTGYGSLYHKEYFTLGLNHNVPLIDGNGEIPPQKGHLLKYSAEEGTMIAMQPKYRPNAIAGRTLAITGGSLVDVAQIKSRDGTPHALGLAFHIEGKADLPSQFTPVANFTENKPVSFKYWKSVKATECKDEISIMTQCGKTRMKVTFKVKGQFKIWHAITPDTPPKLREGFYLETYSNEATFMTILTPVVEHS